MKFTAIFLAAVLIWHGSAFSAFAQQPSPTADSTVEPTSAEQQLSEEQLAYHQWATEMWDSMDKQTGHIDLPGNHAAVDVPESFYYLDPTDSRKVLVEVWGNPAGAAEGILGMLFPADTTPFDAKSWGVTIEYEQDGYVEDGDASDMDYQALLEQMQEDTRISSEARVEQGYEPIVLIGWAAPPYYDIDTKKLHWAKEIQFGDAQQNTLNYNIRVLGRKGVLVLNFIAGMDQLDTINQNLDNVLAIADFKEGSRYADFDPEMDEVAAYGIGALITGKVLAKTGFLAAVLLFLKKFGVFILIGIGAFLKKILSGRKHHSD